MMRNTPNTFAICSISDVPIGQARMFVVNEKTIGIYNVGGEFFALDDPCPHAGASLALGIIEGDVVRCRIHHWRFCIRSGTYLDENKSKCNVNAHNICIVGNSIEMELNLEP